MIHATFSWYTLSNTNQLYNSQQSQRIKVLSKALSPITYRQFSICSGIGLVLSYQGERVLSQVTREDVFDLQGIVGIKLIESPVKIINHSRSILTKNM